MNQEKQVNFEEIARRAETGLLMESNDFLIQRISVNVAQLKKKWDIKWDGKTLINLDDELADRCWAAGKELLLSAGVYSSNSRRIIEFTPGEVEYLLKSLPGKITMGEGKDVVSIYHRNIEDQRIPFVFGGPFNADVDEGMFLKLNQAFAQEKIIDSLFWPGYLKELNGVLIRPESALSIRASMLYGQWAREATRRAGRPGMPINGFSVMAVNELASTNEQWGLRSTDPRSMMMLPELQIDDVSLARTAYYLAYGCPIYLDFTPLIGGYGGGPDGTSIVAVACHIAAVMLGADICHFGPQHLKYKQQTSNHSLFVGSLVNQAIARNSRIITSTSITTGGRPGSEQYGYECAALVLAAVTGGANVSGPRPAQPLGYNNVSPLMARLMAEVAHATSMMSRSDATPVVEEIYIKYKDKMTFSQAPKGLSFEEMYDLNTLTPTPEHQQTYNTVKEELIRLGIPLN